MNWMENAACRTAGALWAAMEGEVEAAAREAQQAVARPLLLVCESCPVVDECARWAEDEEYSGVAGGKLLLNGKQQRRARRARPRDVAA